MLCQEDFKSVTLADRAFFERHYALYPQTHSENTFTTWFAGTILCIIVMHT